MRLSVTSTARFRKELRRAGRRGKDLDTLETVVALLSAGLTLPGKFRDHPLRGDMVGYRECHLEPDWLLVYRVRQDGHALELARTGTHSDLFG